MRLVVTRPQADSERTAAALRARGHEVLVAPLMRVEPVKADLSGTWGAVIITSANVPGAIAGYPACNALFKLPLFAVGRRSADAARAAGAGSQLWRAAWARHSSRGAVWPAARGCRRWTAGRYYPA